VNFFWKVRWSDRVPETGDSAETGRAFHESAIIGNEWSNIS
jgi:hypothetical protein